MIQVIGTKKCKTTQKALRFFQERGVSVHFLDLQVKSLSPGELDNCARLLGGLEALVDRTGNQWKKRGMEHMDCDLREELLADMDLVLTPIIRQGKTASIALNEAVWKQMAEAEK